jgi:bifunctional DNase/RNase
MLSDRHVVILKETGRERYLPIWIGRWEATAIASQLQGHVPDRPMTHDLLATVLRETGVTVERIVIAALERETFHARLVVVSGGVSHDVDARPSDAIALALRIGTPIFAMASVLESASLGAPDAGEGVADDTPGTTTARSRPSSQRGAPPSVPRLEATGEPIDPRKLELFRSFVNSLGSEGEGKAGKDASG